MTEGATLFVSVPKDHAMSDDSWRDKIVGARMAVDSEFADRVEQSSFSRQQWGLVMTATQFEIRDAEDPNAAQMVANTEQLPSILPELDSIEQQMQAMAGGGSAGQSGGGIFGKISKALGLGGGGDGVDEDQRIEAEELTQEYADALQAHLESAGRWEEIRELAASEE